jgi:hypothetical protein
MAERLFIQPPGIIELDPTDPVIFLGGPIQDGPVWQYDAGDIIHDIHSGIVVASPRKEYPGDTFDYNSQVEWERTYLKRAGHGIGSIMFYLPPRAPESRLQRGQGIAKEIGLLLTARGREIRAYGQTSRFEMGWWFTEHAHDPSVALSVGMPGGFGNERYLTQHLEKECPDVPNNKTLEETCWQAVRLALEKAS